MRKTGSARVTTRVEQLRQVVRGWRMDGLLSAVVPTMGALHAGHLSLIEQALRRADRVVVTIFVNPRQFAAGEDLAGYPRRAADDLEKIRQAGAHVAFMPPELEMYPDGFATAIRMSGAARAGLEDRFRPEFFDGVAIIVAKLLNQAGCDYAMFGEKDYQQLMVVTRMARDLDIATTIVPCATVREADGLAMSSRNSYLSTAERRRAALLHQTLVQAAEHIKAGTDPDRAAGAGADRLSDAGFKVEYLEARNAVDLSPIAAASDPVRLLVAAWLGTTRLIDNIEA